MKSRRVVPKVVEVFRAQESTDGDREADAAGGPIHISSSWIYSCSDYMLARTNINIL